jgi:hypothetical protein
VPRTTVPRALLLAMVFLHVLANALIAQALPQALRIAKNNDLVRTATALGKLGSIAALLDILITPQLRCSSAHRSWAAWCARRWR